MNIKLRLQQAISQAVKKVTGLTILPQDITLEHPENETFGDYSTNIAMTLFGKICNSRLQSAPKTKLNKFNNPLALAEAIVKELSLNSSIPKFLNSCCVAAPGFINLSIKNDYLIKQLEGVLKAGSNYGKLDHGKGKKIMVEFAHPNTHKAFHIGHLRNITTGETLVRILEACGYKVIRTNYQGDVGLHIAKCLWVICKSPELISNLSGKNDNVNPRNLHEKVEFLGKAYAEGNKAYESDEKAKKEILLINKKIYDHSDLEITKLWQETRQWSLDYFETIYKIVDSHFDRYYFESEVYEEGRQLVLAGLKRNIFVKSKGAIIFPGSKYGLHDRVFITGEGNPTYEAKDMALGKLQFSEYQPDLIIHNVGPEQSGYFKVVFAALARLFPYTKAKEYHLAYGWVRLKKGKMSSRLGNVVLGEWLLDEAKKKVLKIMERPGLSVRPGLLREQTAQMIAVGAVKYSFLKQGITSDMVFDFEESINLEGNSGPYLQYTCARAQSVLRKSQISQPKAGRPRAENLKSQNQILNLKSLILNHEEIAILRTFYKFPEVIEQAGKTYSPNLICNYLYDLAQKFNTFYNKHRIITQISNLKSPACAKASAGRQISKITTEQTNFRLLLTSATVQIIKNGLNLLGIKCPEKM